MAAASLDVNFKEELSAIEQCESDLRYVYCSYPLLSLASKPAISHGWYAVLWHWFQIVAIIDMIVRWRKVSNSSTLPS